MKNFLRAKREILFFRPFFFLLQQDIHMLLSINTPPLSLSTCHRGIKSDITTQHLYPIIAKDGSKCQPILVDITISLSCIYLGLSCKESHTWVGINGTNNNSINSNMNPLTNSWYSLNLQHKNFKLIHLQNNHSYQ